MTEHRATEIASEAILLVNKEDAFRLPELKENLEFDEEPSNSMIRAVLRQLEEGDWLERDHPEGRIWYASDNIENL
ncbi:hypothetical protein [Haladaptatus halobius]|uniref:hypothetical protein n=1 Tax=Haladaptatus halobius TaxID=2884875 RepID=UPI001D09ED9F|nr:hypothetical protein [Haladaptatus halobius]